MGGDDYTRAEGGSDRLYGGDGNDGLIGGYGNDIVDGGDGDDRLAGAGALDQFVIDMGQGEIDVLTGGAGKDTFTLGGGNNHSGYIGPFYLAAGNSDYALITDFNKDEDKLSIQRPLTSNVGGGTFSLGASPDGLPSGTGIFLERSGRDPELFALLQGVEPNSLSISGSYFDIHN